MSYNALNNTNNTSTLAKENIKGKFKGVGLLEQQPLVVQENRKPVISAFAKISFGRKAQLDTVENVASIGLQQIIVTGTPTGTERVYAVNFKGNGNVALANDGVHTLTNVPKGCLFLYGDGSVATLQGVFGSEPILMYQKRNPFDLRFIEVEILDTATGLPVTFTDVFLWLLIQPINWQ